MNAGSLVYQALYWALPLCFVFRLLFQESGGNNYSAELKQQRWAGLVGTDYRPLATVYFTTCDIRPLVTVCVTTCNIKQTFGGLASSRKWSIVVLLNVYFTCTVVCFTAFYCVLLQLFHSVQRTCLDLSKAIVLYQKRICCKYDLSMILSKQ